MFRILRVVYSKPIGQLLVSLPVIQPVTYQTFTPQHVRVKELGVSFKERLEKMKETFDKVTAFLQTTGPLLFSSRTHNYVHRGPEKRASPYLSVTPANRNRF